MPAVAQTWAAFSLTLGNPPGPMRGASVAGQPFLSQVLGPTARLVVEVAWGANPSSAEEAWPWSDITGDVYQDPGISFTYGRADQAAATQPANGTLTLDNRAGAYSLGGESGNWPNVRQGVPMRVRIDPNGSGFIVAFQGNAVAWTPSWDVSGKLAVVQLEIAGVLRRFARQRKPVRSAFRRAIASLSSVVAYWPCDVGSSGTYFDSDTGGPAMTWTGFPTLASNSDFVASDPLPVLKNSIWTGPVPTYTPTGSTQVRFMGEFATSAETDGTVLMRVLTTGSAAQWDLIYRTGGNLSMNVYDRSGASLAVSGIVSFNLHSNPRYRRWSIEMVESGGNVNWQWACIDAKENPGGGYFAPPALVGRDVGYVTSVIVNPGGGLNEVVVGQITVENVQTSIYTDLFALTGNTREWSTARFRRLCTENAIPFQQYPGPPTVIDSATRMGPQRSGTLIDLFRECELADQGIIFDGVSNGLVNVGRDARENATPALVIDAAAFELAPEFKPTADDRKIVNQATVTRTKGAQATYEDVSGPMGSAAVGLADIPETVNLYADGQALDFAAWLVHSGTVEGYRYPQVTIDVAATPRLAPALLTLRPGSRIDIVNVRAVLPTHPAITVSLVVEGVQMTCQPFSWRVTLQCSPFDPWRIVTLAQSTGDTGENVLHLDTSGARLVGGADAGATSLTVETYTGPVWTQNADDFPFDIAIGGIKATVTGIAGTVSPQVFTVNPLTVARLGGAPVVIWYPPSLGLALGGL